MTGSLTLSEYPGDLVRLSCENADARAIYKLQGSGSGPSKTLDQSQNPKLWDLSKLTVEGPNPFTVTNVAAYTTDPSSSLAILHPDEIIAKKIRATRQLARNLG